MQEMEPLAHLQQLQIQTLQSLMALTKKNSELIKQVFFDDFFKSLRESWNLQDAQIPANDLMNKLQENFKSAEFPSYEDVQKAHQDYMEMLTRMYTSRELSMDMALKNFQLMQDALNKHNASEGLQPLMKVWTDFLDQAKQNDFLKQAEEYQKQMQENYMSFFKQSK